MSACNIPGGQLYFETAGAGPAVVCVHGFSLDTRLWAGQVGALTGAGYQVIRYDLRGFGQSSIPAGPYAHFTDLLALLDQLHLDQAHIMGLSLGGGVAVDFALAHPERALSLIAVDAALGGYPWTKDWGAPGRLARSAGLAEAKAAWLADELFAPALARPASAAPVRAMMADYSGWHWLNRDPEQTGKLAAPAYDRAAHLALPTLVIMGEHDHPDFHGAARHLEQQIPRARRVVLAGLGHLPNLEAPEVFNVPLLDFLRQFAEA